MSAHSAPPNEALVGPVAIATLAKLHVDLLFLGVHGMSERAGFTTPNLAEAETARALVTAAGRLIVLADHTKWGVVGLSEIATLDEADVLVTDTGLPPRASDALSDRVGDLLVAEVQA